MNLLHLELHCDALATFLRTYLSSYVQAENAIHTDGLLVPDPTADNIIVGGKNVMPTLEPGVGIIELAAPGFQLDAPSLGQTGWDEQLTMIVRFWVMHVGDMDRNVEEVYRIATRFGRAILQCVLPQDNNAFGNHASVERVIGSYRQDPEAGEKEEIVTSGIFQFVLMDSEVAP